MTSKEALIRLYIMADTPEQAIGLQDCYDIVEKDLDVLELLKALFKRDVKLGNKVCTGKIYYDECFVMFTSEEAYNKIKEWLNETNKG